MQNELTTLQKKAYEKWITWKLRVDNSRTKKELEAKFWWKYEEFAKLGLNKMRCILFAQDAIDAEDYAQEKGE